MFDERDEEDSPCTPVEESKCKDGYPDKPSDVKHIRAKEENGDVKSHLIVWGEVEDGIWIRASDEDMENLYARV